MLFGKILKQSSPYCYNHNLPEIEEIGPVLAIHNVALGEENLGQTLLWVRKSGEEFLVAVLGKDKLQAMVELNLYIYDNAELVVKGPGVMHVVGSFEMGREKVEGDEGLFGDEQDNIYDDDYDRDDYDQDDEDDDGNEDDQQQAIFNQPLSFTPSSPYPTTPFTKPFIKK